MTGGTYDYAKGMWIDPYLQNDDTGESGQILGANEVTQLPHKNKV